MAVKYYCPKCGRRFVDWGAEKLGYKCPGDACDGEVLILPGSESGDTAEVAHKAKRAKKRKAILPAVSSDIDIPELEEGFSEDVDLDIEEDVDEEAEEDLVPIIAEDEEPVDEVVVVEDVEEVDDESGFNDAISLDEEPIDLDEE